MSGHHVSWGQDTVCYCKYLKKIYRQVSWSKTYSVLAKFTSLLDASKLEKSEHKRICSYLTKIGITVETVVARPKNTNPSGHPRENKTMLAVGKGPPAPFSESRHWDRLSGEGQPANRGSFLRSCGWRRQSSEVLYVTYQHGLPFNQRVERKDKVKPSSLGNEILKQTL